jgi:hypothetical protein
MHIFYLRLIVGMDMLSNVFSDDLFWKTRIEEHAACWIDLQHPPIQTKHQNPLGFGFQDAPKPMLILLTTDPFGFSAEPTGPRPTRSLDE